MAPCVFPEPIDPNTAMPVYNPFSGITSHCGDREGLRFSWLCTSPMTAKSSLQPVDSGYGGSAPPADACPLQEDGLETN